MSGISLAVQAQAAFAQAYGGAPFHLFQAPGRVNLIGEHTDYNDGFVLPCAINVGTVVALRARSDGVVRVLARDFQHQMDQFRLDQPIVQRADLPWANYVRGVLQQLLAAGLPALGADLAIAGNVPRGAGLSSSASLEVALATAFNQTQMPTPLHAIDLALLAQRAENQFVGCHCGNMDQIIAALGAAGHALLIDCRSLHTHQVPLPPSLAVMIVHSNVPRGLVDSEYNLRRQQCELAAQHYGVPTLRDLSLSQLQSGRGRLDEVIFRRARHVVTENQRTQDAAQALGAADFSALGHLMAASHQSMHDDFAITVPAVDRLVDILQAAIGPFGGARMTGGGFGGCVVALLPHDLVAQAQAAVQQHYRAPNGQAGTVYVCHSANGAGPYRPLTEPALRTA